MIIFMIFIFYFFFIIHFYYIIWGREILGSVHVCAEGGEGVILPPLKKIPDHISDYHQFSSLHQSNDVSWSDKTVKIP